MKQGQKLKKERRLTKLENKQNEERNQSLTDL